MSLRVTLLGTGTSHGVPMIGCECRVCRSSDPRDRRSRPSVLIELVGARSESQAFAQGVQHILVDTSTDLRAQALAHGITRVDALLFTHSHADHILGLDEVRRFNVLQRSALPAYADARTIDDLRRTFFYIFAPPAEQGGGIPQVRLSRIAGPFTLGGVEIVPVPLFHGRRPILGYRIADFAYLTDCNAIPDGSWPLLAGVRTLVLDALRERPHPTHFSLSEALRAAERIGAARTYFTHVCHDLPHAETCARLPAGVELAYDGLVLDVA
ncbi:MAG: MBL fold metallo-hydrolase [Vicinamibacterales bacterium]